MDIKLNIMTMDCAYANRMLNSCSESSRKFVADLRIGRNHFGCEIVNSSHRESVAKIDLNV